MNLYTQPTTITERTLKVVMPEATSFGSMRELAEGDSFAVCPVGGGVVSSGNVRTPIISINRIKRPIC